MQAGPSITVYYRFHVVLTLGANVIKKNVSVLELSSLVVVVGFFSLSVLKQVSLKVQHYWFTSK